MTPRALSVWCMALTSLTIMQHIKYEFVTRVKNCCISSDGSALSSEIGGPQLNSSQHWMGFFFFFGHQMFLAVAVPIFQILCTCKCMDSSAQCEWWSALVSVLVTKPRPRWLTRRSSQKHWALRLLCCYLTRFSLRCDAQKTKNNSPKS